MASNAIKWWQAGGVQALDEIAAAHAAVGGTARGRRYATEQINNAYAVLLSSQFQKFCRDLHSEAADYLAKLTPVSVRGIIYARLTEGRKLDSGNPNPGNLGSDFGRLGLAFWAQVESADALNAERREKLEELNLWRNALAHQDFSRSELEGRSSVLLQNVRQWRRTCHALATQFDAVIAAHLTYLSGARPW